MSATGECMDTVEKRFVWNYYNRIPRPMSKVEPTNSWTASSGPWRASNANPYNNFSYVCGESIQVEATAMGMAFYTAANWGAAAGIGIDQNTTDNSILKHGSFTLTSGYNHPQARYVGFPGLGYHVFTWLERAGNSVTFYGDNGDSTYFQLGIIGSILG